MIVSKALNHANHEVLDVLLWQGKLAGDMEAGDVELHVVAEAVEDELFGDAGVEFGTQRLLRLCEDVTLQRGEG